MTGIVKQIRSENGITVLDEEVMADCSSDQKLYVDVRRDFFLKDALRECKKKKFDPKKLLRVCQMNVLSYYYFNFFFCVYRYHLLEKML